MTFKLANRVLEDASNQPSATQAYNLSGTAVLGFQTFESSLSSGDTTLVLAEQVDANGAPSGAWELCNCTFSTGTPATLTRDTLVESSTGALIDWSALAVTPRLALVTVPDHYWAKVDSVSAAGVSAVDFTNLQSGKSYAVVCTHVQGTVASSHMLLRVSSDNGLNFDAGATDYQWFFHGAYSGANSWGANSNADSGIQVLGWLGVAADEDGAAIVHLHDPGAGTITRISGHAIGKSSGGNHYAYVFGGVRVIAGSVNAVRLVMSSGNFAAGEFTLYEY